MPLPRSALSRILCKVKNLFYLLCYLFNFNQILKVVLLTLLQLGLSASLKIWQVPACNPVVSLAQLLSLSVALLAKLVSLFFFLNLSRRQLHSRLSLTTSLKIFCFFGIMVFWRWFFVWFKEEKNIFNKGVWGYPFMEKFAKLFFMRKKRHTPFSGNFCMISSNSKNFAWLLRRYS